MIFLLVGTAPVDAADLRRRLQRPDPARSASACCCGSPAGAATCCTATATRAGCSPSACSRGCSRSTSAVNSVAPGHRPVRLTGASHCPIDLNTDLGEGFGRWTARRRRRAARRRHQRQRRLRLPRRRPVDHAAGLRAGRRARRRDRRPGRLPRPGRLRPAVHRRRARTTLTADVLYQLGALEAFARAAGARVALRQAARRALQRDRPPRGAGRRGRRGGRRPTTRRCRCSACPARRCCGWPSEAGLTTVARGVRRPRLHPGGHAGLAAASPARCCTTPTRSPQRCVRDGRPASRSRTSTAASLDGAARLDLRARRHPGRGRDRPRGPRRARARPASTCAPFVAADAADARAALRRRRAAGRARRPRRRSSALYAALADRPRPGRRRRRPGRADRAAACRPGAGPTLGRGRRAAARRGAAAGRAGAGERGRDPGASTTARTSPRSPADRAAAATRWSRRHTGDAVDGRVLRLRPRLRLPASADDGRLDVPRREQPAHQGAGRVGRRWPASSPASTRASRPGGWQLIGRTDVAVWDLDRDPPALLAPRRPGCGSWRSDRVSRRVDGARGDRAR